MQRLSIIVFTILILVVGIGTVWYLTSTHSQSLEEERQAANLPALDDSMAIYTDGTYGFSIFYPESAQISFTFDPFYHVGNAWRANALPNATGTPIVSIVPYSVSSENSYPRYYTAMIRIGASEDAKELARCEVAATDNGETALPDATFGGTTWKAFSFESAGMMQYVRGVSYRTIKDGACIALEQIRTGSSYRDDAPSAKDIPDTVLETAYKNLGPVVTSFTFAR